MSMTQQPSNTPAPAQGLAQGGTPGQAPAPAKPSFFDKLMGRATAPAPDPGASNTEVGDPAPAEPAKLTLDDFSQILQDGQTKAQQHQQQAPQDVSAALQNPETLQKIVEASGVSKAVTPEMTQAFVSGDPEQINGALQNLATDLFSKAIHQATLLNELSTKQKLASMQGTVEQGVQRQILDSQLTATNPALQSPAVKAAVSSFKDAILASNPNVSPAELNQALQAYTTELASAFAPQQPDDPKQSTHDYKSVSDWEKYLSS